MGVELCDPQILFHTLFGSPMNWKNSFGELRSHFDGKGPHLANVSTGLAAQIPQDCFRPGNLAISCTIPRGAYMM